ncbi:MAG: helix-turn-helix domain-containing protein [Acidimicrobiia bacterium]
MELAAFVVQAVLVEKRSVREVARAHGVSKTWLYELVARYRAGGEAALVPRSRRPHHSPNRVPEALEDEIVALRKQLAEFGTEGVPTRSTPTSRAATAGSPPARSRPFGGSSPDPASSLPNRTSARRVPMSASKRACPTSAGRWT